MARSLPLLFFLFIVFVTQVTSQNSDLDTASLLKIPALGRSTPIGSLYDSSTETFTSASILSGSLSPSLITTTPAPSTNTKFGLSRSYSEKRIQMEVSLKVTLSALLGLIKVSGSASFLHDEQKRTTSVVGSVMYNTVTVQQTLEIFYDEALSQISLSSVEMAQKGKSPGTIYVIVGIAWGCNVIVKFEDYNEEKKDLNQVSGSMSWLLNSLGNSAGSEELEQFTNFNMQVYGDLDMEEDRPSNLVEVIEFIEDIPRLVSASNEGKGTELYFYLLPIERVQNRVLQHRGLISGPLPSFPSVPAEDIPEDSMNSQVGLLERIAIVKLKLNDLETLISNNRPILTNEDLRQMHNLKNSFANSSLSYRTELKRGMRNLMVGKENMRDAGKILNNIEEKFTRDEFSVEKTEDSIDNDFKEIRGKIDMVWFLKGQGSIWVSRGESAAMDSVRLLKKMGIDIAICGIHFQREFLLNEMVSFAGEVMKAMKGGFVPVVIDCDFPHESCELEGEPMVCEPIYNHSSLMGGVEDDGSRGGRIRQEFKELIKKDAELYERVRKLGGIQLG